MVPFEHAATSDDCADCDECGRCAKHDPNGRCESHGDYFSDNKNCPTCIAEAVHYDGCDAACGGAWPCPGCERLVGYCCGCTDDMPELCDDCWRDVTQKREAAAEARR